VTGGQQRLGSTAAAELRRQRLPLRSQEGLRPPTGLGTPTASPASSPRPLGVNPIS
jgi:hypothetical protein